MTKWQRRTLWFAYLGLISILPIYALADYGATTGSGLLIRAFDATHGGTSLCAAANTQCQAVGLVNSAGAEIGTSGAPVRIDPTGTTTQPISGTVTANAGTNLNTSALSTAALQGTNTATTAHTCAIAGYSELGCLGQIDDDVKGAAPAGTNRIGYVSDDPCTQLTKTNLAIATASGTTQLVAASGSTQVYVCSFSLIGAATAVVNLVGGTGATCTTGTPVAAIGSTTAANGMSLAANGGLTFGNGGATVVRTTTAGHGLCLIQSGTTALAGNITYIQQ